MIDFKKWDIRMVIAWGLALYYLKFASQVWASSTYTQSPEGGAFSESCVQVGFEKCQAYQIWKNIDVNKLRTELSGQAAKGGVGQRICQVTGGRVRLKFDEELGEVSACRYIDGSEVTAEALANRYQKLLQDQKNTTKKT